MSSKISFKKMSEPVKEKSKCVKIHSRPQDRYRMELERKISPEAENLEH